MLPDDLMFDESEQYEVWDTWGGYNLFTPDGQWGDCQSVETRMWCLDGSGSDYPNGGYQEGGISETHGQMPAGTIHLGLYDGGGDGNIGCGTSRSEYCSWIDQDNTCLGLRLYYNGEFPIGDTSQDVSWDDDFVAETYVKMSTLCDDDFQACINTTDGSEDDEAGICADGWLKYADGTPFYNDDGSEQLWFTNYIIQVVPNCDWF